MERIDLYSEVHKGIRRELLALVELLGRADNASPDDARRAVERTRELLSVLEAHAGHEEGFVHPILEQLRPDVHASLEAAHRAQKPELERIGLACEALERAGDDARGAAAHALYLAVSHFVGSYLIHMNDEETTAMPLIWAAMTDEEILNVQIELRASVSPEEMARFMAMIIPAINPQERTAMFAGLRAGAPQEVLDGMCALAANVLPAAEWESLRRHAGL